MPGQLSSSVDMLRIGKNLIQEIEVQERLQEGAAAAASTSIQFPMLRRPGAFTTAKSRRSTVISKRLWGPNCLAGADVKITGGTRDEHPFGGLQDVRTFIPS